MGAAFGKCFGSLADDPAKVQAIADKAFGFFDKDKSGFISANEVSPAAERALQLLNLPAKPGMIESVFGRVAGGDGKLDKAEFQQMMAQLVAKAKTQAPAGAAA